MTQVQKRALYNLLRSTAAADPSIKVEAWQVDDYRAVPIESLFQRLERHSIPLNRVSFIAHADNCDSPEEFVEHLIGDQEVSAEEEDRVYLLIFELWRRLMSEKPSLSILCDELDHQIFLYDEGKLKSIEPLEDAFDRFFQILNQNVDEGLEPKEAFKLASAYCANDILDFIYDFIAEQIDHGDDSYAKDLMSDLQHYVEDNKWFILLQARLAPQWPLDEAHELLEFLINEHLGEKELAFNFELLELMIIVGPHELFHKTVVNTLSLLTNEEEFQDLLAICLDYYERIDQEKHAILVKQIIERRATLSEEKAFDPKDKDVISLLALLKK